MTVVDLAARRRRRPPILFPDISDPLAAWVLEEFLAEERARRGLQYGKDRPRHLRLVEGGQP